MTLNELQLEQRERILEAAARHGAQNVRVFGSVARGRESAGSDVDFLVDLAPDRTLMDLGGLQMDLQDHLGGSVDVATEDLLRPELRREVLRQAVAL